MLSVSLGRWGSPLNCGIIPFGIRNAFGWHSPSGCLLELQSIWLGLRGVGAAEKSAARLAPGSVSTMPESDCCRGRWEGWAGSRADGETGGWDRGKGAVLRRGKKFPVPVVGPLECCGSPERTAKLI